jgi:hypothetical protein
MERMEENFMMINTRSGQENVGREGGKAVNGNVEERE